jgi:hypothetical protein
MARRPLRRAWLSDRAFMRALKMQPARGHTEAYLARQVKFDSDIWIVEVDDRSGRNFLDQVVNWAVCFR